MEILKVFKILELNYILINFKKGDYMPCEKCSGTGAETSIYDEYTRHCSECDGYGFNLEDD
jgi:DnaJ-class molecular chaperone